jgi:hypothetical protein
MNGNPPLRMAEMPAISPAARDRVHGYFRDSAYWPLYLLGIGCATLLTGLFAQPVVCIATGGTLVGLAIFALFRPPGVANTREVDVVAHTDFVASQALAMQRLPLTAADLKHREPCRFRSALDARPLKLAGAFKASKRGKKDKQLRWTPQDITVVNFGHEQLLIYQCVIDLTTGRRIHEDRREVMYRDVLSVETSTETVTVLLRGSRGRKLEAYWQRKGVRIDHEVLQADARQTISLLLASGDRVQLAAWDGYSGGVLSADDALNNAACTRLRALLREIKQPAVVAERPARIVRHTRSNP